MSECILIVEDEQTVADIIAINLRLEAFDVKVALNGTTGLELAREGDVDLIICDIMMPDIDGYEICRQLKKDKETGDIPIILLTARTEVEDKVAGLEAGADDFITKPFSFADLIEHINMNLDRVASKCVSNSLTGLPGNIAADDILKAKVMSGEQFSYLRISINHLRPYREVYGVDRFENVIRFTSKTITEAIAEHGDESNACYLGEGNFSIITTPEKAEPIARDILDGFDCALSDFYDLKDLNKACITTFDRCGAVVENPLMTVSIGISSNRHRPIKSHWEAAEIAREVLEYAMSFPASKYEIDRRLEQEK
ncbi:MAG: hypothetical protein CVT63_02595 [Candidatus Anoxymicrobium japonicum]|uniref:Response regulatory domain-containing protein n=1 Tax=Candidatus Anoxymicrobium japonicum TaxID=2013648 RepID=A0A2N3G758_9ACTN|nr:MAG: hypothetical protein CVT63_02595 [Candidatus Anoxymicrobium japonicum]